MTATIERVVVALDAASENRAAIGAAVRLAARWKAHLHGVFVEDDNLHRLASLPFARQVTLGFGAELFDTRQAERQMRVYAERARRDLGNAAQRHGVEWSFEIVGDTEPVGETAGDFFVACAMTRPIGGHFRVECRLWTRTDVGPATRLLAHHEGDRHGAVAALLHGQGPASERLLDAASRLAEANDARLVVVCTPSLAKERGFRGWLDARLTRYAIEADVEVLPVHAALHHRISEMNCRLVAIEATAEEAQPDRLRELVAAIACDVLVVR